MHTQKRNIDTKLIYERYFPGCTAHRACLIALLLLFVMPVNEAIGQAERPVQWTLEPADTAGSDSVVFRLGAQIDEGWYVYAPTQPAAGPYPMEVSVATGGGWQMAGDLVAPRPHRLPDRHFGIISEVYRDSPDFFLPVMPVDGDNGTPIEVLVLYQPCTSTYCLPPRTDSLHWPVAAENGGAEPEAEAGESADTAVRRGVPATAPTAFTTDPSADLESAIARVRALYFGRDFHHAVAEGDAALERWPESSELLAWTVVSLARSRTTNVLSSYSSARAEEAVARAESLAVSRPNDVWSAIALAFTLTYHSDRRSEALEASLRPLEMAPTMPEAVWVRGFILHNQRQYQEVPALIDEKWPVVDRQWSELLSIKGNTYRAMPERIEEGLEILARVRELDPQNVSAHYLAGNALLQDRQRIDEGTALLERAAALSPTSIEIATSYWRAINARPDLDEEEKKALIRASAGELVEQRGQYPGILRTVASQFGFLGLTEEAEELQERVLTEFAHTVEAEWVLADRWNSLNWRLVSGEVEDTVTARAELSSMYWSLINRPRHHQPELLGNAYSGLFNHLRRDERVSPDTLLLLARGAVAHNRFLPHAALAIGLAERGVHLDVAREIAREGIDAAAAFISRRMEIFDTPDDADNALNRMLATVYAAMGYVDLKAGDLETARESMDRALALKPDIPQVQFQAGALAEAEGDLEAAENHYAWGEREERMWPGGDKPNSEALKRIYTERHGSMEGYEEYLTAIMERDRDSRWQRVADTRIEEPRDLPAIDLEWLGGGRIGPDELKGRIVVINFWGVWCPPCVAEAPQIQQFHEKYRDDPGVVFLTINAFDPDLDKVRTWMEDNEYDWPVLIDDNFATPSGIRGYPTTWFADSDGRIVFEHTGASAAVFEEFVWRVEMLLAEGGS